MTTKPVEQIPLPDLSTIVTHHAPLAPYGSSWEDLGLCLATTWLPGDPMPTVCARQLHELRVDPWHVSHRSSTKPGYEPHVWQEEA